MINNTINIRCAHCQNSMNVKIPKLDQQQKYIFYLQSLLKLNKIPFNSFNVSNTYGQHLYLFDKVDKTDPTIDIRI